MGLPSCNSSDTPFAGPKVTHDLPSIIVTSTCISLKCPAAQQAANAPMGWVSNFDES